MVSATMDQDPFPNIEFKLFSQFIEDHFSAKITLATVLTLLFSLTENSDLLNLHARQQNPATRKEHNILLSGWMKALARALEKRLGTSTNRLFKKSENRQSLSDLDVTNSISTKLHSMSKLLSLYPFNKHGQFLGKLQSISQREIEPVHVICPEAMECETVECNGRSIQQTVRDENVPQVTLIKGTKIYEDVPLLTGKCPNCQTRYYADHERAMHYAGPNECGKVYLNSAKYLKVGQNVWVDRVFSGSVLNAMYSFHASSSAFVEFWNDSFWSSQPRNCRKLSHRQVWQAFVQESIRSVATGSNITLMLQDALPIDEVTKEAFNNLGANGVIKSASDHACSECTHEYKETADVITGEDPAALVGIDENRVVPVLVGENADLAAQDAAQARENAANIQDRRADAMDVDNSSAPVVMAVVDGIVMGPTVSINKINCQTLHITDTII